MNALRRYAALAAVAVVLGPQPAPGLSTQAQIEYLLSSVASSNCEFNRNGVWYDPKRAEAHLRLKYNYLWARHELASAEDFIAKAASSSSRTGRNYLIRCPGQGEIPSQQWLLDRLTQYRASLVKPQAPP